MTNRPRQTAQTHVVRLPSPVVTCRRCGAFYVADEGGMDAHVIVFGHTPTDRGDS